MPTTKLTDSFLRGVDRPPSSFIRYWDTDIKGFVAHVQKTTTTLYYDRNNQRHLIGRFPTVTMPQARETAPSRSVTGHIVCWDHDHVPGTLHSLRHTFATVSVLSIQSYQTMLQLKSRQVSAKLRRAIISPNKY